jgi:tetratricopeptide (TPR) repeat protein
MRRVQKSTWNRVVRLAIVASTLFLMQAVCGASALFVPYPSYTYSMSGGTIHVVESPAPYIPIGLVDSSDIGYEFKSPQDMVIDKSGNIHIVDAGLSQIVILDRDYNVINLYGPEIMLPDGHTSSLNGPSGIAVTGEGEIYIADTGNARIVVLDSKGKVTKVFDAPVVDTFSQNYQYTPVKLAVDPTKRIYVVSKTDNMGIIELDPMGDFVGYIGSNKAVVDPIELLWKRLFYSKEQNEKSIQAIPVEYTNLSLDDRGFIYAVSSARLETTPVKRLNPSGKDILRRQGINGTVAGDIVAMSSDASVMIDIAGAGNEAYFVLDNSKGRIFCYNSDGYMLYAFGALGQQLGTFRTPVAVEYSEGKLYVLDSTQQGFTVFEATSYGKAIMEGDRLYYLGEYQDSIGYWEEVIRQNSNFELAYAQIGKILLREGDYRKAMAYFKLGDMRGDPILQESGYNKALSEYRSQFLGQNLAWILTVVLASIAMLILIRRFVNRKKGKDSMVGVQKWEVEE